MVVLVLSACPPGLRGYLTRWLLEISAGVFVGKVSRRVRERLWSRTVEMTRTGRAIMVVSARNEQGLDFRVHGHHWRPIDVDGITLMLRPHAGASAAIAADAPSPQTPDRLPPRATGWSNAARRRQR